MDQPAPAAEPADPAEAAERTLEHQRAQEGTLCEVEERALWIDAAGAQGQARPMLGILSLPAAQRPTHPLTEPVPAARTSGTAVLIVVGGPQYRVGSHRQFVRLARHLAGAGHTVLRFDFPGMGDSPGEPLPFEDSAPFIAAAIEVLLQQPGVARVVLWGLCDGASASLLYVQATQDPRVAGLALLNPWLHNEDSLVRTQVRHYYRQRLAQASFWRKLLSGGVGWAALREFARKLAQVAGQRRAARRAGPPQPKQAPFQDRMGQGWLGFPGPLLLLLSGRDLTAQAFVEHARGSAAWAGWEQRDGMTAHTLAQADHSCSDAASARMLETFMATWLRALG